MSVRALFLERGIVPVYLRICVGRLSNWGFRYQSHTSLACLFVYLCWGFVMFVGSLFFRTRNIACLFLYLCWPIKCLGVSLCLWAPLFKRRIFTHLFRLFICVKLIISVHGCFTAVTSRLGSSRSAPTWRPVSDRHDPSTFSGVGVHYLKFTSAIPSRDMTSGVTVETVGNDS